MQNIIHRFYGLDTSRLHNKRFVEVIRPGVYSGFLLQANPGYQDRIDIVRGSARHSVLVTPEGVIIEETADIPTAVRIQPADSVRTRIDAIVCEYQYTTDIAVEASYKVIRGRNQVSISVDPVAPVPENDYQVVLGYVWVRPQLAVGGSAQIRVDQADIVQATKANLTTPEDMAALRAEMDQTNPLRLYVGPGTFPSADGAALIRWPGGYSSVVDASGMNDGETRYYLFAINDDSEVSAVAYTSDANALPTYNAEVLPLAIARINKALGAARIVSVETVLFPFVRMPSMQQELTSYQMLLGSSVYQYIRTDLFRTADLIDLAPISGPTGFETLMRVFLDRSDSSLTFQWLGATLPDDDLIVVTENLLADIPLSNISSFQVSFDSGISGLTFEYSAVGKYSGFTNQRFQSDKMVSIPAGGAGRLYLRFRIPKDVFQISATQKIYSYGVLLGIDAETINRRVVADMGMENLLASIPNLISNGNFRFWGRKDANGDTPAVDAPERISYPVAVDQSAVDSGTNVFAADGWQFTRIQFESAAQRISREIYSSSALGADIENALDTCLFWEGKGGPPGSVNHLEYRVPVRPEMRGKKVTFAFDYKASSRDAAGIAVALYSRDESGTFTLIDRNESGASTTEGLLLVTSNVAIAENTYAVGLIVILRQTTGDSQVYVRDARAAIGSYLRLAYSASPFDRNNLRAYYERGRARVAMRGIEGDVIATSVQFGQVKHDGLSKDGLLVLQTVSEGNSSVGVDSITYEPTVGGFVVSGRVIASDLAILDVEWEAYPLYPFVG